MPQNEGIIRSGWPVWLNAAILLLVSFVVMTALSLRAGTDAEIVAVVFPPWWTTQRAFVAAASANAAIVRQTAVGSILVVRPGGSDGLTRLREAGVWLTIDPQAIGACSRT